MQRRNVLDLWTFKDDLIPKLIAETICLSCDGRTDLYALSVVAESIITLRRVTNMRVRAADIRRL